MRLVIVIVLFGAAFLGAPARARAWNEVGHAVIALIAYDELGDPQLQLRLVEMLKKHPHYEQFLAKNRPASASLAVWVTLRAANWPDWVRPPYNVGVKADPSIVRYHRAFDHFVNMPIFITTGPDAFTGQVPPVDPDRPDIHSAYRQRLGELNEPMAAGEDKAVALAWLAHLIGDIHQPLHAGTMFSRQFPEGDLGGNRFGVKIEGKPTRLHTYWDNVLGEVPGWENDTAEHQADVYALVVKVRESLRDPKYSREALQEALSKNTFFASWIAESHELAKTVAYCNGPTQLKAVMVSGRALPDDAPDVGEGYDARAQEVARLRAALAGYRLADKLKQVLARQPNN